VVVPEADHFSERAAVVTRGFDPANLTDRDEWTFGFDYQADDLFDEAAVLDEPRLPDALQQVAKTTRGA
jgi:hypothetical protein